MHDDDQVPIWLFIGGILLAYGTLILGAGLFALASPPPEAERVALFDLHADVWWGLLMSGVGLFYVVRFRPGRRDATEASARGAGRPRTTRIDTEGTRS